MNFFLEFCVVNFERGMETILMRCEPLQKLSTGSQFAVTVSYIVKKFCSQFALSYALVSFCLFSYDKYMQVYFSLWFLGHLLFMGLPVYAPYLKKLLPQTRPLQAQQRDSLSTSAASSSPLSSPSSTTSFTTGTTTKENEDSTMPSSERKKEL